MSRNLSGNFEAGVIGTVTYLASLTRSMDKVIIHPYVLVGF